MCARQKGISTHIQKGVLIVDTINKTQTSYQRL